MTRHARPRSGWWFLRDTGRRVRVLTGVDERLLGEVPSERARYTALGGTVLGTATIAVFSMSLALSQILGGFTVLVLFPALAWGVFVLNLDRWLVSSSAGTRWHRRAAVLGPRLLLAFVLGVVIAEPVVLRIFETAIEQKIRTERQDELNTLRTTLTNCNPDPTSADAEAAAGHPDCGDKHRLPFVAAVAAKAQELAGKQADAEQLQQSVETNAEQLAKLDELARNECAGTAGPGLTGQPGRGEECRRREREADDFRQTYRIDQNNAELRRLRQQISTLQAEASNARANHQRELESAVAEQVAERRSHHGPIGLLERFRALHRIVEEYGFLTVAVWFVRLFFIVVDCLPVLVKFIGGTTTYDRLVDVQLASAEREHRERVRTDELAATAGLEVRQHEATTDKQVRCAEIDLEVRRERTRIEDEIDRLTNERTEKNYRYGSRLADRAGGTGPVEPANGQVDHPDSPDPAMVTQPGQY